MDEHVEILIEAGLSRRQALQHAENLKKALEKRKKKEEVFESRDITEPKPEYEED